MLYIPVISTLETIIGGRSKRKKRAITLLKVITRRLEFWVNPSIPMLEKITPYMATLLWILSLSQIAQTKAKEKEQYDKTTSMRHQRQLFVYIDGNRIKRKIAVAPSIDIIRRIFLGPTTLYTVYTRKFQGIAIVLNITLNRPISGIKCTTIFTNN